MSETSWDVALTEFINTFNDTDQVVSSFGLENKKHFIKLLFEQVFQLNQSKKIVLLGMMSFKILTREPEGRQFCCTLSCISQLAILLCEFSEQAKTKDKEFVLQEIITEILRSLVNILHVSSESRHMIAHQTKAMDVINSFIKKPIEVDRINDIKGNIRHKLQGYVHYHETMTYLNLALRIHAYLSDVPELCHLFFETYPVRITKKVISALSEIFLVGDFESPTVIPIISAGFRFIENYVENLKYDLVPEIYARSVGEAPELEILLESALKIKSVPGLTYPMNLFATKVIIEAPEEFFLVWTSENDQSLQTPWTPNFSAMTEKKKNRSSFEFVQEVKLKEQEKIIRLHEQLVDEEILMHLINNMVDLFDYTHDHANLLLPYTRVLTQKLMCKSEKIRHCLRMWIIYDENPRNDIIYLLKRSIKKYAHMPEIQEFAYTITGFIEFRHLLGKQDPLPVFEELSFLLGKKYAQITLMNHEEDFDMKNIDLGTCFIQ